MKLPDKDSFQYKVLMATGKMNLQGTEATSSKLRFSTDFHNRNVSQRQISEALGHLCRGGFLVRVGLGAYRIKDEVWKKIFSETQEKPVKIESIISDQDVLFAWIRNGQEEILQFLATIHSNILTIHKQLLELGKDKYYVEKLEAIRKLLD